ncbi:MAG TPA: imidazole glycerol phosphate synthase subunit HisH, partial [Polyangiaceae bacterium]
MRVVMIDIGLGNLRSVHKALETAGSARHVQVVRSADADVVRQADAVVMPGQNVFGAFLDGLGAELREALRERLAAGMPYLGFCLGLHALFEASDESPGTAGLGW